MSNDETDEPSENDYILTILRSRLAKGEITIGEFNTLKDTLIENNSIKTRDKFRSGQEIDVSNIISIDAKSPLTVSEKEIYSNEVLIKSIRPNISVEDVIKYAKEVAEKNSKGGFLGRGKIFETAFAWELLFFPYYDLEIEETIQDSEKRGWFKKETITKTLKTRVNFDAVNGDLVDVTDDGISYVYAFLKDLNSDEINLLYFTSSVNRFSIQELRGLGHSDTKARRLADSLAAKGIITKHSTRPATYQQIHSYPTKPTGFKSLIEKYPVVESHLKNRTVPEQFNSYYFQSKISNYWSKCRLVSSDLIYYPYYGITYKRENATRAEILDAVTGTRQPYLDRIITVLSQNKIL